MQDQTFDAFSRRLADVLSNGTNRRRFLQALGFSSVASASIVASEDAANAAGSGGRPGTTSGRQSTNGTLIDEIAFNLAYDRDAIVDFVSNQIRYEPYAGALRGPIGTLWAGAGNEIDKAQLLVAMLDASLLGATISMTGAVPSTLDQVRKQQLNNPFPDPIATAITTLSGIDLTAVQATPAPNDTRQDVTSSAQKQISSSVATLLAAATNAGISFPTVPGPQTTAAQWPAVLVENGAQNLVVDVVTGQTGTADIVQGIASPAAGALAEDQYHRVTIRIISETISGSSTTKATILEQPLRSQDMVGESLAMIHLDGADMNAMGLDLGDVLGGTVSYTPLLVAGDQFYYASTNLLFGGQDGAISALDGGSGPLDGEPVAEYLEVQVDSPGAKPAIASRTIFDRIGDQRSSDTYDFSKLEPVSVVDLGNGFKRYLPVAQLISFAILPGAVPPGYSTLPDPVQSPAQSFSNAAKGVQAIRQSIVGAVGSAVTNTFIDRPNVITYTYAPVTSDGTTYDQVKIAADVMHGHLAGESNDASTPAGLLTGVATQISEATALDPSVFELMGDLAGASSRPQVAVSAGTIFQQAEADKTPLVVIQSESDLSKLPTDLPAGAKALVEAHIAAGNVVITPDSLVTLGSTNTTAWWVYDPASGDWHDELADGSGGYITYQVVEDALLKVKILIVSRAPYLLLAECIAAIASAANDYLTGSFWGAVAGAVGNYNVCK